MNSSYIAGLQKSDNLRVVLLLGVVYLTPKNHRVIMSLPATWFFF